MLLGAIADDFTGAGDLANTLAKGGMSTVLYVGASNAASSDCEAGVVALKTRSIEVAEAVRQSLEAAQWLLDRGCRQILFKYCSTFDSTPDGNIGPVAEALLDFLGADGAVVCPAFPAAGRRLFMGHLFVGDHLLSESGMQNHPLTPMSDPDIRRWLRQQTKGGVGHLPLDVVRGGSAMAKAFAEEMRAGRRLVVADAIDDEDLLALGRAVSSHRLVTGGSGIALGLPGNFREQGLLSAARAVLPEPKGRAVVLCGSCSTASQQQVLRYLDDGEPGFRIEPAAIMRSTITPASVADWVDEQDGSAPIVYTTADPQVVSDAQSEFGRAETAVAIETFFGELGREVADRGARRIVVGGGETSGAVVEALGLGSLMIGSEIAPGVPVLIAERNGPVGLALKSGNFGGPDFFSRAVKRVGHA